jgi:membrane fusion protein, macrolide-specific efflux system
LTAVLSSAPSPLVARRRRSRTRLWVYGGMLALLLAVGAGGGYWLFGRQPAPVWRTVTIGRGDIENTVTALGTIQPKDYVDVGAQVSGQLKRVLVEVGERVSQGQPMAEIDPTIYETRVRADRAKLIDLEAQRQQQDAEHALAKLQNERNERLFKSNAVSRDALDTSRAQVKIIQAKLASLGAQMTQAQSTLESDQASLSYTKINAPMAGTVVSQTALEGQTLNTNQSAPTIARVANLDTMTVKAQVAEADVVKLQAGAPVYFTTLGMPERRWRSTVRQILPTPETVNDVVLYSVLVDIDNPDGALMTSMTAQVFFVLGEAQNVPVVPIAALRGKAEGANRLVQVLTPEGPQSRRVTLGLSNRSQAQIVSGLTEGEQVIIGGGDGTARVQRQGGSGSGGRPGGGPPGGPPL